MNKLIGLLITLLVICVAIVFASPYWALYQLKNAYDAKDAATINRYIDFPKVQQNIKNQLKPVLLEKVKTVTGSPLLQALNINVDAEGMITKMVNQAVDNTVTETGVNALLTGKTSLSTLDNNAKLLGGLTAVAMDKIDLQALITARNQDELTEKIKKQLQAPNPNASSTANTKPQAHYCGFNCFEVNGQVRGYPITMNMERQGLVNWKIVGVKLPL